MHRVRSGMCFHTSTQKPSLHAHGSTKLNRATVLQHAVTYALRQQWLDTKAGTPHYEPAPQGHTILYQERAGMAVKFTVQLHASNWRGQGKPHPPQTCRCMHFPASDVLVLLVHCCWAAFTAHTTDYDIHRQARPATRLYCTILC